MGRKPSNNHNYNALRLVLRSFDCSFHWNFNWNLLFLQKQAKKSCFHTKKSENKIMKLAKSVIEFHKKSENGKKKWKWFGIVKNQYFFKGAKSLPHEIFCGKKIQVKKKKSYFPKKLKFSGRLSTRFVQFHRNETEKNVNLPWPKITP